MTISHVTAAEFKLRARFLDTFQVRRCWIKIDSAVNLGKTLSSEFVQCVCCEWYNWRRPLSRSAVLFTTLWHCRKLSDERYAHHIQFEFWLLRRLTPAVTDRPPTVLQRQQSVPSVSSTTQLLQRVCCSLAACRQLHLFGGILGFILCYILFFPYCTS